MSEPGEVVILGGGRHAVLVGTFLSRAGYRVRGYVAPGPQSGPGERDVLSRWLGDDAWLSASDLRSALVANGIGSTKRTDIRRRAWLSAAESGCGFIELIHPTAIVDSASRTGSSLQALALSVVQPGCSLGDNVLINTCAVLEHDVTVGSHTHIAPRACVCGQVTIGESVHVGAGAVVLQGRVIADGAVIGAGAVVTGDVSPHTVVAGNPARECFKESPS